MGNFEHTNCFLVILLLRRDFTYSSAIALGGTSSLECEIDELL